LKKDKGKVKMAFGSIVEMESMKKNVPPQSDFPGKEKEAEPAKPKFSFQSKKGEAKSKQLHVVLVGRSVAACMDYLCSMSRNIDKVLSAEGLSFYFKDAETSIRMIETKKQLENCYWSGELPRVLEDSREGISSEFLFGIGIAGHTDIGLSISFHCCTAGQITQGEISEADGVIALVEDWALEQVQDEYLGALSTVFGKGFAAAETVLEIVLIQCERRMLCSSFNANEGFSQQEVYKAFGLLKERMQKEGIRQGELFIVQVYGGLSFSGLTEGKEAVLDVGTARIYDPVGCHIPMYPLIEKASDDAFFETAGGRRIIDSLRQCYAGLVNNPGWQLTMTADASEEGESV